MSHGSVCVHCRKASSAMTRKKPAIVVCEDFSIWLGNTSDIDFSVEPSELLGFGTGHYEEKVVSNPTWKTKGSVDYFSVCCPVVLYSPYGHAASDASKTIGVLLQVTLLRRRKFWRGGCQAIFL